MQRYFVMKDEFKLEDSDIRHIRKVMRMRVNDLIEVVYKNRLYVCKIICLDPFDMVIDSERDEYKRNKFDVTVAIGLVKEQKMDLILQKLTELGVNRIIPVSMERSIVRLDKERFDKKKARWEAICKEASEQAKRLDIPTIGDIMSIYDLVEADYDVKLVCSTKENLKTFDWYLQSINECAKIIIVIGPEGGISDREEDILCSKGYNRVSLGNLIFRVETASIYVASIFNFYSSMRCNDD